jgi:hypothetical protein
LRGRKCYNTKIHIKKIEDDLVFLIILEAAINRNQLPITENSKNIARIDYEQRKIETKDKTDTLNGQLFIRMHYYDYVSDGYDDEYHLVNYHMVVVIKNDCY